MRIPERLLSCIVFVGLDENGPFTPLGTGFVIVTYTDGFSFQSVVTARHVIEGTKTSSITLRVNKTDGTIGYPRTKREDWRFHPDPRVDLALCPTHLPMEEFSVLHLDVDEHLLTEKIVADEQIGVGDDVFMAGMFTRHLGDNQNRPIVRVGNIAALAKAGEKVETTRGPAEAHLVEARSIAGLSGSPVFVHMAPFRVMDDGGVRSKSEEGSLLSWRHAGSLRDKGSQQVVSIDDAAPGDMNTGIGIVIPGKQVQKLLDMPELKARRQQVVDRERSAQKNG